MQVISMSPFGKLNETLLVFRQAFPNSNCVVRVSGNKFKPGRIRLDMYGLMHRWIETLNPKDVCDFSLEVNLTALQNAVNIVGNEMFSFIDTGDGNLTIGYDLDTKTDSLRKLIKLKARENREEHEWNAAEPVASFAISPMTSQVLQSSFGRLMLAQGDPSVGFSIRKGKLVYTISNEFLEFDIVETQNDTLEISLGSSSKDASWQTPFRQLMAFAGTGVDMSNIAAMGTRISLLSSGWIRLENNGYTACYETLPKPTKPLPETTEDTLPALSLNLPKFQQLADNILPTVSCNIIPVEGAPEEVSFIQNAQGLGVELTTDGQICDALSSYAIPTDVLTFIAANSLFDGRDGEEVKFYLTEEGTFYGKCAPQGTGYTFEFMAQCDIKAFAQKVLEANPKSLLDPAQSSPLPLSAQLEAQEQ